MEWYQRWPYLPAVSLSIGLSYALSPAGMDPVGMIALVVMIGAPVDAWRRTGRLGAAGSWLFLTTASLLGGGFMAPVLTKLRVLAPFQVNELEAMGLGYLLGCAAALGGEELWRRHGISVARWPLRLALLATLSALFLGSWVHEHWLGAALGAIYLAVAGWTLVATPLALVRLNPTRRAIESERRSRDGWWKRR